MQQVFATFNGHARSARRIQTPSGSPIRLIDLIRQVARTSAGQEPSRDTSTAPLYDWPAAEAAPA